MPESLVSAPRASEVPPPDIERLTSRLEVCERDNAILRRFVGGLRDRSASLDQSLNEHAAHIGSACGQLTGDLADLRQRIARLEAARSVIWMEK